MHSYLFHARLPLIASAFALLALALAPSAVQAQVTVYTSPDAFRAASTVCDPFLFDGYADPGSVSYYGHSYSFDTVDFTSSSLKVISPDAGYGDPFGGHPFLSGFAGGPLYLAMSSEATAFGANFAALGGGPMDIIVNDDQVFHFDSGATFAGFISRDPITTLSIDGGADGPALSGIMLGDAAPVPEASSVVSLGLLLLFGAGYSARRRHAGARAAD